MLDRVSEERIFGKPRSIPANAWRRGTLAALVIVTVAAAVRLLAGILEANGLSPLEMLTLALFTVTFAWISIAFWTAVAGFALQALRLDPLSLRRRTGADTRNAPILTRTALVMPVFNEDVARVAAGLEAVWSDLQKRPEATAFDLFLLSDSTDETVAAHERSLMAALRRRLPGGDRIFYRQRRNNAGRKAGNVAEFCERWGAGYDYMVVLDADSVMTANCLLELVRTMQANPAAGIIQTVPLPIRQQTPFGRALQFAASLYSPMLATGMSFWQTDAANYWGHNAVIRVQPFMDHCGLPELPGQPPLGGEILSHDFVEAALMRRGGWHVYLMPDIGGSYEEVPANLLDYARRDRRWAEGNLQHLRLLTARGLHPLSRLYFVMGALAYGCSLLWLLMLTVSTVEAGSRFLITSDTARAVEVLFPEWPVARTSILLWLLGTVAAMLILPKLLGVLLGLCQRREAFGGGMQLAMSALAELVFSIAVAPILMTYHALFVVSILCGNRVLWTPQNRAGHPVRWSQALRSTGLMSAVGVLWALGTALITPVFLWAVAPVLVGLNLAPALTALSSRPNLGLALHRRGLLLTPTEVHPPAALRRLQTSPAAGAARQPAAALPLPATRYRRMPPQRLDVHPEWTRTARARA